MNSPLHRPPLYQNLALQILWLPVLFWVLPGCTALKSHSAQVADQDDGHAVTGMHYFLPRASIEITGKLPEAGKTEYRLTITRIMEADQSRRYRLRPTRSIFHDDDHTFEVNESGLLKTTGVVSISKVKQIVLNLTDTLINMGSIYTKGQRQGSGGGGESVVTKLKPFKVVYDPYDAGEIATARQIMADAGFVLEAERLVRHGKQPASDVRKDPWTHVEALSESGIYYHPNTTVQVAVRMGLMHGNLLRRVEVPVPDLDDVAVFRMDRSIFADRTETITIADGEISGMNSSRPSELMAFTTIPLEVSQHVVGALNELPALGNFLWRPAADPNQNIKNQMARLKAENDRLQAEQAVRDQAAANEKLKQPKL